VAPRFRFGPFDLEPAGPSLRREGEELYLRRKTFQVLVYLVEQRHRFVSKQELWDTLWGGSAVTDDSLVQCVADIRRVLADDSRQPQYIRTQPKVGYRFIAPVTEVDDEPVAAADSAAAEPAEAFTTPVVPVAPARRMLPVFATIAALLIVIAAATMVSLRDRRASADAIKLTPVPGRPSVMVMYLENKSASPDLDWLRQGLADMLISGLARSDRFTIVGRQQLDAVLGQRTREVGSAITLDRAVALAADLHVDKVVLGTFGRLGERLRVDVQLYDTKSGALVASEALVADRAEQILTEIDGLSVRLAGRLGSEGRPEHPLSDVMTDNLEAYRNYSLALEKANALRNVEAIDLLTKATALDPGFAMAHARIGYTYAVSWDRHEEAKPFLQKAFNLSERLTPKDRLSIAAWYAIANLDFREAARIYRRLIEAYPLDVESHAHLCKLLHGGRQFDEAIQVARAGLAMDPESTTLHNRLAGIYGDLHQYDRAIEHARRYVALAPAEPNAYDTLALMLAAMGRYDEAEQQLKRALTLKPDWEIAIVHLANTYLRQGRFRESIQQYQRYVDVAPSRNERLRGLDNLARITYRLGRRADAQKFAERLEAEGNIVAWTNVLQAFERHDLALVERGRAEIEKEIPTNRGIPGNQRFRLYQLGTIALRTGKTDDALAVFRDALREPTPTWGAEDYETCLADALVELRRPQEAIPEYERILQFNPNHAAARYGLARAYDAAGRPDSAVRQYEKFLDIWRDADRDVPAVMDAHRRLASLARAARQ
jgi:DNA-binding winged helix-turn-helix (wHTH) protein/tetratricopeptide (TPR) repeat protein